MARTDAQLTAAEIINVEEINGLANNTVFYKSNTGVVTGVALWANGTVLTSAWATSTPTFSANGTGDVTWPASATDNAIARFDLTTGKIIQNSAATIADTTGDITAGKYNTVAISWSSTPTLAVTGTTAVSGTNTGDQTSIVGITGTKAQFNTAVSDGDIVFLDSTDTITGAKTFLAGMFALRNVANTFNGLFTNTNTANRTYTLQDRNGTLADNTDLALKANLASPTFTGTVTLPSGQALIAPVLWTATSGTLTNCTWLPVAGGGTGVATLTAFAPVFGGTTGTGAVQSGTAGTAGQILTSNGAGVLPTFQTASSGGFAEIRIQDYAGTAFIGILGQYDASRAGTLVEVTIICDTLPVGSNLIGELRKNSTTSGNVLSTTLQVTTTESLTNGKYTGATPVTTFSSSAIADGDVFYVYLTGVGSTTAALNPRVILRYT